MIVEESRDKEMVAIKNQLKAEIMAMLEELAEYATVVCNGNRALLLSSGFDVTEEQSSSKTPSIELIEVELGGPGVATTRVKKQVGEWLMFISMPWNPQAQLRYGMGREALQIITRSTD